MNPIFPIFFPHFCERADEIRRNGRKFVHYTSAEVAMQILKHGEIWLRNTTTMNDYSEVRHGFHCVQKVLSSSLGESLQAELENLVPTAFQSARDKFKGWQHGFEQGTFITCISEHDPEDEPYGKLSMWRAYGGTNGVALVVNPDIFLSDIDPFGAATSPVLYGDDSAVSHQFEMVLERVKQNRELIASKAPHELERLLFHALRFAALSTKHLGFSEEREWRVVHMPLIDPTEYISSSIELVRGVPQIVKKIRITDNPRAEEYGISMNSMLDKVIVGPTQYASVLQEAFIELLRQAKIAEPEKKVHLSWLPLRT